MCTLLFHVSFHCVEHLSLTPPPSLKKRVGLSQKPVKTKFYYRVHTVTNSAHPDKRGCNVWCYVLVTLFVCFIATHNEKYSYLSPKNEIGIYRNWCNIITLIRLSEGDLRIRLFPPFSPKFTHIATDNKLRVSTPFSIAFFLRRTKNQMLIRMLRTFECCRE